MEASSRALPAGLFSEAIDMLCLVACADLEIVSCQGSMVWWDPDHATKPICIHAGQMTTSLMLD